MHRHNTAISRKLAQSRCAAAAAWPVGELVEMGSGGEGGEECEQCW